MLCVLGGAVASLLMESFTNFFHGYRDSNPSSSSSTGVNGNGRSRRVSVASPRCSLNSVSKSVRFQPHPSLSPSAAVRSAATRARPAPRGAPQARGGPAQQIHVRQGIRTHQVQDTNRRILHSERPLDGAGHVRQRHRLDPHPAAPHQRHHSLSGQMDQGSRGRRALPQHHGNAEHHRLEPGPAYGRFRQSLGAQVFVGRVQARARRAQVHEPADAGCPGRRHHTAGGRHIGVIEPLAAAGLQRARQMNDGFGALHCIGQGVRVAVVDLKDPDRKTLEDRRLRRSSHQCAHMLFNWTRVFRHAADQRPTQHSVGPGNCGVDGETPDGGEPVAPLRFTPSGFPLSRE